MKNYLVIGNPIEHSISPKIHNYWFKENKIKANYDKMNLEHEQLEDIIRKIREKKIHGVNVTAPFKEKVISHLDKLSPEAKEANSVNTIYLFKNSIIGHNTDIAGFYMSLKDKNINLHNKNAFILGSGGVVASIIIALKKLGIKKITISNRTKDRAVKIKEQFGFLEILDWGETKKADIIINTTSLGLKETDNIDLDYSVFEANSFFYDLIYNPKETKFLLSAKKYGFTTLNGLMMFVYQAAHAFEIWHKVKPEIDRKLITFIKND